MNRTKILYGISLFFILLFFILGGLVYAQRGLSNTAVVTYTDGFVDTKLTGAEGWSPLIEGTELNEGDEIETGTEGEVELRLSDGSVIKIGPDSRVVIKELGMVEITETRTSTFGLIRGRIRAVVTPFMKKESKFTIETENATVGVRGTDFGTIFDPDTGETNVISISDCCYVVATNFPHLDPIDVCTNEELFVYSDVEPGDAVGIDVVKLNEFLDEMEIMGKEISEPEDIEPPYISRAFVNNRINLEDVDDTLSLTKDDLNAYGKVYVSGDAEDERYIVERVEYSLDGGGIWETAVGTDHWYFEFLPEEDIEYELMLRAENNMGATSDPYEVGPWEITYLDVDYEDIAKNFLDYFFDYIETGDATGLSDIISYDYDGSLNERYSKEEFEDDIQEFFDDMMDLTLSYQINQVNEAGGDIIANARWNATVEGDSFDGTTKWWLSKDDEFRLVHAEGDWFMEKPGKMALDLIASAYTPLCDNSLRIMLQAPRVPDSVQDITVPMYTDCNPSGHPAVLHRIYYESLTGNEDGFGGEFVLELTVFPNTCISSACAPTPVLYSDTGDGELTVTFTEYGYDITETIDLPQ
jgi:hypothetical protein